MDIASILKYVANHPARRVKVAVADIDGILRGKYISSEKFVSIIEKGMGFCDVIFGWDMEDALYDKGKISGWHAGFPDSPAVLDVHTFRKIPWESDLPFFLGEMDPLSSHAAAVCPRQLLKNTRVTANNMGFTPIFAQEFEWFNFSETPHSANDKQYKNLRPLTPGMFGYSVLRTSLHQDYFNALFDGLTQFGIPIEGLHTETGPGTYEAAIEYSGILEAADRAVLFKTAVKEIAYRHGIMATFMAKIDENLPGCGGNLFYDENDPQKLSELARSYLAGQLYCLPHILPMFAPTINSYKRLVEGAWAPTTLTWGIDNRTVALRVLAGSASATRIETRVIGSDVNPYLAMAACLASGLYGIKNQLHLHQPQTVGNGYKETGNENIPGTLIEATRKMKDSSVARELFGDTFVDHFTMTREWEWKQHLKAVTDWEYKRYFEII